MEVLYILILWITLILPVQSTRIQRFRANLVLYSGFSSDQMRVLYTNSEMEDWKNLTKLTENAGLQSKSLLCGVGDGAWLAYPKPDYQTDVGHNYAKILIGDVCISADHIDSIQPVGPLNKDFKGLLSYEVPFFGSEPKLMTNNENETTHVEGVASLITSAGHFGDWYVEGNGKKYCLTRPKGLVMSGICILPDLENEFGITDAKVTRGCEAADEPSTNTIFVQLQTCFSHYGAFTVRTNYLRLPVITSICKNEADPGTKLGFVKIVDAWKFRMSPSRQMEQNPAGIDSHKEEDLVPIKMHVLTQFFDIFKEGCGSAVPEWYFHLIRYLYMHHLKSAWEETPQVISQANNDKLMWKLTDKYLTECNRHRHTHPVSNETVIDQMSCRKRMPFEGKHSDRESDVLDLLLEGDELDHVIEQVWIMLNYVSPYCARSFKLKNNLWADFVAFFRRQFLLPLLQQWLNPGTWQVYYDYMFSGIPIEKGKRLVISCVRDNLRDSPYPADPVDRPSALIKEFLSLSKKRPPVTAPTRTPKRKAGDGDGWGKSRNKRSFSRSVQTQRRRNAGRNYPSTSKRGKTFPH